MAADLARVQAIDELLAKQAIRDAIYRYCRGEDRLDADASESLWHSDGTATFGYGGELFGGPARGRTERMHAAHAEYLGSSFQVANVLIEVTGQRAVSEAYVMARLWKKSEDGKLSQRVTIGRYLDRWSRRDGVWAADHRRFVFDLSYDTTAGIPSRNLDWFEGRHGREDPSYDI